MRHTQRGQISTEYLILVGFISFLVIGLLGFALFYTAGARDRIVFSQLDAFAHAIITSSEQVYYAGEPSLSTLKPYLPEGIQSLELDGTQIVAQVSTSTGVTIISYTSGVPLSGELSASSGVKRIRVSARLNDVLVEEV